MGLRVVSFPPPPPGLFSFFFKKSFPDVSLIVQNDKIRRHWPNNSHIDDALPHKYLSTLGTRLATLMYAN